jgi:DNA-binding LacI/PurR family transcriptional regulator
MDLLKFDMRPDRPLKRQVADHLRQLIVDGRLPLGTRLPSGPALARRWDSNSFTIHEALSELVQEGLLSRQPRAGTIVVGRRPVLHSVAIYYDGSHLHTGREYGFALAVVAALEATLARRNVQATLYIDPRPREQQDTPWQPLKRSVDRRDVQCIIAPLVTNSSSGWLGDLSVPLAHLGGESITGLVHSDLPSAVAEGIRQLRRRGCRTIGYISTIRRVVSASGARRSAAAGADGDASEFYDYFREIADAEGMRIRPEWARGLNEYQFAKERWGYQQFHALWDQPEHPDGLLVFPDAAARGVILAATQRNVRTPQQLKLVMHCNRELDLICPLAADWLESSAAEAADALLLQAERQLSGDDAEPIVVPFRLNTDGERKTI